MTPSPSTSSNPSRRPPLTGTRELANDDGKPANKLSISGSGHGVKFTCPGEQGILRAVKIYGSRYGTAEAPLRQIFMSGYATIKTRF